MHCYKPVVLNLSSSTPHLSNCPLFQVPLTLNKLLKQMYLLVKVIDQTFHVRARKGSCPLEMYWRPLGRRSSWLGLTTTAVNKTIEIDCDCVWYSTKTWQQKRRCFGAASVENGKSNGITSLLQRNQRSDNFVPQLYLQHWLWFHVDFDILQLRQMRNACDIVFQWFWMLLKTFTLRGLILNLSLYCFMSTCSVCA